MAKNRELTADVMGSGTGLHPDETDRHVGQAGLRLSTRNLAAQHNRAAGIQADQVEGVLAQINADGLSGASRTSKNKSRLGLWRLTGFLFVPLSKRVPLRSCSPESPGQQAIERQPWLPSKPAPSAQILPLLVSRDLLTSAPPCWAECRQGLTAAYGRPDPQAPYRGRQPAYR